ncbi:hypothetical protein NADFUDRAFT_51068 [Nadsonia fulvescens var. elongata DSM 6958]|uniref:GYF domain-containing protein n=1 Tax=Nadsonia fulvescens var. elongata DSM 6958 TaxID=857566 RepID=A0A1E3PKG3_9ASCO|nr:hypothetical protein NADFUDRAFT_51068 [Nadsonia fulvescens var. elongata DSM 6958]
MNQNRGIFDHNNPMVLTSKNAHDTNAVTERDEEQLLLEEDIAGMKKQPKRNQVKIAYGSDSSEDEYELRINQAKKRGKSKEVDADDDDDMFGDSDAGAEASEENDTRDDSEPQRTNLEDNADLINEDESSDDEKVEFMDINAFEKAESLDSLSTTHQNLDNIDDTEDVNIKYYINADNDQDDFKTVSHTKEPQMEAFSLRNDLEEGKFDIDGNYIRNEEDPEAHKDNWLAAIDKKNILEAKNAQIERENFEEEEFQEMNTMSMIELVTELLSYLEVGETPMEALRRYGNLSAGNKLKSKNKNRRNKFQNTQISESEKNKRALIKEKIDRVTYCTDQLLQKRLNDIYDLTKEELLRLYQRETGESYLDLQRTKRRRSTSSEPPTHTNNEWEFKWEGAEEVHGPYNGELMKAWAESHFDDRVSVRKVNTTDFLPYKAVEFI